MLIYITQNIFNGHDLSSKHQTMEIIVSISCQPINRAVPVPALPGTSIQPLKQAYVPGGNQVSARKFTAGLARSCLVHSEIQKVFKISSHIESCGTYMKH